MTKQLESIFLSAPLLNQGHKNDSNSDVVLQMETVPEISASKEYETTARKHREEESSYPTDKDSKYDVSPQPEPNTWVDDKINELNVLLLDAIINQDNEHVERLLKQGASPNATCRKTNLTASHAAAYTNENALALLINHNAITNRKDVAGNTPLHLAAWAGKHSSIAMLLDFPSGALTRVEKGNIMLFCPQICSSIIDVGCKIESMPDLQTSWRCSQTHSCETFMASVIKFKPGWTPLHIACFAGHYFITRLLLSAGANPYVEDALGNTPLKYAGAAYHLKKYTIDMKSYVGTINTLLDFRQRCKGKTATSPEELGCALHTAVQLCNEESVQILLDARAPIDQHNSRGNTPLHECLSESKKTILKILIQHRGDLQLFPTVDVTDADGYTILQRAVLTSWLPGVCIALEAGANITHEANDGTTAIHLAARGGNYEIQRFVLNKVVNVDTLNYENEHVETPLICAIRTGNLSCVQAIVEKGASLELKPLPIHTTSPVDDTLCNIKQHIISEKSHSSFIKGPWVTVKSLKLSINNIFHAVWLHATEVEYIHIVKFLLRSNKSLAKLLYYRCPDLLNMIPVELAAFEGKFHIYEFLLRQSVDQAKEACLTFNPSLLWVSFHTRVIQRPSFHLGMVKVKEGPLIIGYPERLFGFTVLSDFYKLLAISIRIFPEIVHILPMNKVYVLHAAIESNNREIVSVLINNGADLSIRNDGGKTAISVLMKLSNSTEMMESIFDDRTKFHSDFEVRECSVVKFDYRVLAPTMIEKYYENQMRVLKAFLEISDDKGKRRLLSHPLVETYLYTKWRAYSVYYYVIILLYLFYATSLSAYIVSVFYTKDSGQSLANMWDPYIWSYIIFGTLSVIFIQEMSFVHVRIENWLNNRPPLEQLVELGVKCGSFCFGFATPLVITMESADTQWWRTLAVMALVLGWSNVMLLLSKTPMAGYYMQMFWVVSSKVFKILLIFSPLIIMFSFCFMIQFYTKAPFDGPLAAIIKTFVMMTSEFDYEDNFSEGKRSDLLLFIVMLRFVFVIFLILNAIVLMNLMIGVAASDVQDLIKTGNFRRTEKQIKFLYALEEIKGNKSAFHILCLHKWLIWKNVLQEYQLTPKVYDYENEYNDTIRESLTNKSQELIQKEIEKRKIHDHKLEKQRILKAIAENKQTIRNHELKLDEILQCVREIKQHNMSKNETDKD